MAKLRVDKIAAPIVKDEFTGSVHFDGTGDYFSVADNGDFDASGDFTIELWANLSLNQTNGWLVGKWNSGSNQREFLINVTSAGKVQFYWSTDGNTHGALNTSDGTISAYEWNHYAWVKNGSVLTGYINGVALVSKTDLTSQYNNSSNPLYIGTIDADGSSERIGGYISNLRICKGHAVYTENFTVPTRELEVHTGAKGVVFPAADNRTVLLACQSSTDATAEATGRHTITVNGDPTAADANPGLFRRTLNLTTVTENTGAVYFDGSGDYLETKENGNDFDFDGDFTIETWIYFDTVNSNNWHDFLGSSNNSAYLGSSKSGWIAAYYTLDATGLQFRLSYQNNSAWEFELGWNYTAAADNWYHVVYTRESGTIYCYVNGVKLTRSSTSGTVGENATITTSEGFLRIGGGYGTDLRQLDGYLSNLRICKGHAVYKSADGNFTVPTRELEVHQGPDDDRTVLLACYDGENIFADKSGRHIIAAYGDRLSSPTPTATDSPIGSTTVTPGLTRNVDPTDGPTFQGGAGFTSQNWLTLPKGTTTERYAGSNSANPAPRGLRASGQVAPNNAITNTVDSVEIATTGDALDFGDLIDSKFGAGGIGSPTRGLFCGGGTPTRQSAIDYFTISTRGNGQDFGDIFGDTRTLAGATGGNATRGLTFGGATISSTSNVICAITISSTGSVSDFGDCTQQNGCAVVCSPTRAVSAGGDSAANGSNINSIDFVTIQSMGNAFDFGDLLSAASGRGVSSITRGLFSNESTAGKRINYVTIATTGNAVDFGDLISNNASGGCASYSSLTRGCFAGIKTPSTTNTIEYFTIPTLGDALDFGDLTQSANNGGGCSNGHGGLG